MYGTLTTNAERMDKNNVEFMGKQTEVESYQLNNLFCVVWLVTFFQLQTMFEKKMSKMGEEFQTRIMDMEEGGDNNKDDVIDKVKIFLV